MPSLVRHLTPVALLGVVAAATIQPAVAEDWFMPRCDEAPCDVAACDSLSDWGCDEAGGGGLFARIATHPANPVFRTLDTLAGGLQRMVDSTTGLRRPRRAGGSTIRRVSGTSPSAMGSAMSADGVSTWPGPPTPPDLPWEPIPTLDSPSSDLPGPLIPAPPSPPENPWQDLPTSPSSQPAPANRRANPFEDDASWNPGGAEISPATYEDYFR